MTKILPSDYNFVLPCAPETLVRLGIDKDGGYIVDKKIIDKTNILVSFGMADEYSFEKEFLKKNEQKRVFIFDYSISKRFYIQEIFKNIRRLLKFKRKFKDLKNTLNTYANFKEFIKKNGVSFFSKKITNNITNKKDIDISGVFKKFNLGSDEEITLKVDIEGDEYKIVDDILSHERNIAQIVMEYHDTHTKKDMFFDNIKKFQKFYNIIHLHGNNYRELNKDGFPINIEVTLCKKKYIQQSCKKSYILPIEKLDYPNNPKSPDLKIEFEKN